MKLRFTRRAIQDLHEISDYLRARNPTAARRLRAAILDCLQGATVFPKAGRRQNAEGVRRLVTRKYPYLIYYRVDEVADEIVVITIQHAAREREFSDL